MPAQIGRAQAAGRADDGDAGHTVSASRASSPVANTASSVPMHAAERRAGANSSPASVAMSSTVTASMRAAISVLVQQRLVVQDRPAEAAHARRRGLHRQRQAALHGVLGALQLVRVEAARGDDADLAPDHAQALLDVLGARADVDADMTRSRGSASRTSRPRRPCRGARGSPGTAARRRRRRAAGRAGWSRTGARRAATRRAHRGRGGTARCRAPGRRARAATRPRRTSGGGSVAGRAASRARDRPARRGASWSTEPAADTTMLRAAVVGRVVRRHLRRRQRR